MDSSGTGVPDPPSDATLICGDAAGLQIEYGPAKEPWGVTRFYVRDPFGRLVNILAHD